MSNEHGIWWRSHLWWSFLAIIACSGMEGWVLPYLAYLRVVWQLYIIVQEGVLDHLCTLTHIIPD